MSPRDSRPLSKLRTIEEAADLLTTSRRTVARLIKSRALPCYRIGHLVRIAQEDIATFLDRNRSV
jgi:excisionase family DNA binding protein